MIDYRKIVRQEIKSDKKGEMKVNKKKCYIEVVLIMVLGMIIMPSSAQFIIGDKAPPCWDTIGSCIGDNVNRSESEPKLNPSSPKFNFSEYACCTLIQQTAQTQKQCFCYVDTFLHQNPSYQTNITSVFKYCKVADSLTSLYTFCQGMFPIC